MDYTDFHIAIQHDHRMRLLWEEARRERLARQLPGRPRRHGDGTTATRVGNFDVLFVRRPANGTSGM